MTKTVKTILIITGALAVGGGAYAAFKKKKVTTVKTKVLVGDPLTSNAQGQQLLLSTSSTSVIQDMQSMLNDFQRMRTYLRDNCGKNVKVFSGWMIDPNGAIIAEDGSWGPQTDEVLNFYHGSSEITVSEAKTLGEALWNWRGLSDSDSGKCVDPTI